MARMRTVVVILFSLIATGMQAQYSGKYADMDSTILLEKASPEVLNAEANRLITSNASRSMQLATEALNRSLMYKDRRNEYAAYNTLGTLYFNIGNYSKAYDYFTRARNGFSKSKDKKGLAYAQKYMVLSLEKQEKYDEALKENSKRSKISVETDKSYNSSVRYDKARLKSKTNKKDEAISELKQLATDSTVEPEQKVEIYNKLGDLYVTKNDTVNALKAYYNVVEISKNAPQLSFSSGATQQGFYSPKTGLIDVAGKISELNLYSGKTSENIRFQNQLIADGLKRGDYNMVQTANYNLGTTYLSENDAANAVTYLFRSANYAQKSGNTLEEQKSVRELAKAYEKLGQYDKALNIYKRYIKLADSIAAKQKGNEAASLALNAEFIKQEQRIKGLMQSQQEKEARLKRQKTIVWTLSIGLLIFAFLTWLLVRNINQKKKANMVIKLQSLRTQMNPHFIFNSLNSVNNFIAKNDERSANKYISDFSKLMRTVLKNSDQDFVSLSSEIETLGIYLDLEHFRFGDKFDYNLDVAPDVEPEMVQIPPMLIQPYIENAIWHGLRYKEEKGLLEVKFFNEDKKLYCTIYDNGIGRKKSSQLKTDHQKTYQSTGIRNTKERIEILNKLHSTSLGISIKDIENGDETGTLVKISLPHKMYEESL